MKKDREVLDLIFLGDVTKGVGFRLLIQSAFCAAQEFSSRIKFSCQYVGLIWWDVVRNPKRPFLQLWWGS